MPCQLIVDPELLLILHRHFNVDAKFLQLPSKSSTVSGQTEPKTELQIWIFISGQFPDFEETAGTSMSCRKTTEGPCPPACPSALSSLYSLCCWCVWGGGRENLPNPPQENHTTAQDAAWPSVGPPFTWVRLSSLGHESWFIYYYFFYDWENSNGLQINVFPFPVFVGVRLCATGVTTGLKKIKISDM